MTTLADLTEEQRKACVGMWADYRATPVVIATVYWYEYSQGWFVDVFDPTEGWGGNTKFTSRVSLRAMTYLGYGTRTAHR